MQITAIALAKQVLMYPGGSRKRLGERQKEMISVYKKNWDL